MNKLDSSPRGSFNCLLRAKARSSNTTPRSSDGSLMDHPLPEIDPLEAAILSNNRRSSNSKDASPALQRNCPNIPAKILVYIS